jgi:hypothetical protein
MSRNKGRGRNRPRPDHARIARLEQALGMDQASTAKAVHPAVANRAGRPDTPVMVPLTDVINAMTPPAFMQLDALPRDPYDRVGFGPQNPMVPSPLDPPRPDTGRPEPRLSEYEVGWNLPGADYRLVPWKILRDAARQIDILRRCIEVRKRHVVSLKWARAVSEDAVEQALLERGGNGTRRDIEAELREQLAPEIARLTAFWRKPWKANNLNFKQWASMLLEEHLVVDAVAIYPQMTYGGDCLNLEIVSGSTIKPLRDWRGALPQPPYPAYQQILYGFPRGEFTATIDDTPDGKVAKGAFAADQLYYYRGTPFAETPYGLSAVEQALISARLYLKRQGWMLSEYDDGVTPATWMIPPENASQAIGEPFTVAKRREWERAVNDELQGNSKTRQRTKVAPPGFKPQQMATLPEQYKPDYDYFLIRILAAHMDVTLPEINITEPGGLGASGYHEGQEDVQNRIGTRPTVATVEDIVNEVSTQFLAAPPQLEFKMLRLESEDEAAQDAVAGDRVASGRMTLNEDRDRTGQPRYPFPEADMPMLQTQRGVVFLEGASQSSPPGELVMPAQDMSGPGGPPGAATTGTPAPAPGAAQGYDEGEPDEQQPARGTKALTGPEAWAEAAAYRKWLAKGGRIRQFRFEHLTAAAALQAGIIPLEDIGVTATFVRKTTTDPDPKVPARAGRAGP